jgi:hypothetical protein
VAHWRFNWGDSAILWLGSIWLVAFKGSVNIVQAIAQEFTPRMEEPGRHSRLTIYHVAHSLPAFASWTLAASTGLLEAMIIADLQENSNSTSNVGDRRGSGDDVREELAPIPTVGKNMALTSQTRMIDYINTVNTHYENARALLQTSLTFVRQQTITLIRTSRKVSTFLMGHIAKRTKRMDTATGAVDGLLLLTR